MGDLHDLLHRGPGICRRSEQNENAICCPLIFVCLFLYNFLHYPPYTTLEEIYIPSLDKNKNLSTDTTLTFEINIKNENSFTRFYYDPLNITFYDGPNRLHTLANFTAPHFDVRWEAEKTKGGTINTTGFGRKTAMKDISIHGYWVLRVDLYTSFRYKTWWKGMTQKYIVGANIHIGDKGIKVHHKNKARLVSGATKIGSSFERNGFILISLFVTWFLCSYGV